MNHRVSLVALLPVLLGAVSLGGCLQPWDSRASNGALDIKPIPADVHTVVIEDPVICLTSDDGCTNNTTDACEAVEARVLSEEKDAEGILVKACSLCHSGGAELGGFAHILDKDWLIDPANMTMPVSTATPPIPPKRYIIPGDPLNSRVYERVAIIGDMPKAVAPGQPHYQPTFSDMSVLYQWMAYCLGATPPEPPGVVQSDGGTTGTTGGGTGGASGGGTGGRAGRGDAGGGG